MKLYLSHSTEETEKIGLALGLALRDADVRHAFIALRGDMGVGKTAFTRGFAEAFAVSCVKSPTYTIVNEYRKGKTPVFHFDLYRIGSTDELDGFGFDEYVENGLCIAEWSENLGDMLPEDTIRVTIQKAGESERTITIDYDPSEG